MGNYASSDLAAEESPVQEGQLIRASKVRFTVLFCNSLVFENN
jgi:hypothetical protein